MTIMSSDKDIFVQSVQRSMRHYTTWQQNVSQELCRQNRTLYNVEKDVKACRTLLEQLAHQLTTPNNKYIQKTETIAAPVKRSRRGSSNTPPTRRKLQNKSPAPAKSSQVVIVSRQPAYENPQNDMDKYATPLQKSPVSLPSNAALFSPSLPHKAVGHENAPQPSPVTNIPIVYNISNSASPKLKMVRKLSDCTLSRVDGKSVMHINNVQNLHEPNTISPNSLQNNMNMLTQFSDSDSDLTDMIAAANMRFYDDDDDDDTFELLCKKQLMF